MKRVVTCLLLGAVLSVPMACREKAAEKPAPHSNITHSDIIGPAVLEKDADSLAQTKFTAYLNHPITPGKNLIWCATMALTWNELMDLAGGEIHLLEGDPPIVTELGRRTVTRSDLDYSSYVALAGLTPGILDSIPKALELKFKGQASPELLAMIPKGLRPESGVAYSYLFKDLAFSHPFEKDMPLYFARTKVNAFGFGSSHEKQKEVVAQVSVHDYRDNNDFIVDIKTASSDDKLVLAKVHPDSTLGRTIETVQSRLGSMGLAVEDGTRLEIPALNFRLIKDYQELMNKHVQCPNETLNGQPIVMAEQLIRFKLNETGAKLKSEALVVTKSSDMIEVKPIPQLIFDEPFLILMERKGAANPYFALWVDNPELLVPFVAEKTEP